jgi:gamma-glutamyl phosphate reductase
MIRNIIYFVIIIYGVFFFYQKFVASTVEPFFKGKAGNVDFYQIGTNDSEKAKAILEEEGKTERP